MAKRIEKKSTTIGNFVRKKKTNNILTHAVNKQGKVSDITASNDVLRETIFGYKKNDTDPE